MEIEGGFGETIGSSVSVSVFVFIFIWGRSTGSDQVVGDGLIFVQVQAAGVGTNETFIEDAAGELIEVVLFESDQHTSADLGGGRDFFQRDATLLALLFQSDAE